MSSFKNEGNSIFGIHHSSTSINGSEQPFGGPSINGESANNDDAQLELRSYENDHLLFQKLDLSKTATQEAEKDKLYGHKTIGTIGGLCLLIGNMTGPGMVSISLQYQQGGWILSVAGYLVMLVLSTFSGLYIVESMSCLPGNSKFQLRVEFTMLSSIIICAQVTDSILIFIFKKSCGVSFTEGWICVHEEHASSSPFSDTYMLFTLGYIIVLCIIIPLGFLNLDDNIVIQIGCVILMFTIVMSWLIIFMIMGLDMSNLPAFGTTSGIARIMGNVMFNYAYITTIPSWVNESSPEVNINKSIWRSSVFSTIIFMAIGVFGALAFKDMPSSSDILSLINSSKEANLFSKLSVYFFPFIVLASTIPVFSIIVRYNLIQNKLMSKKVANFLAIVLPWIIVIPFATGDWLNEISNWASLFFNSIANFIIPFLLYLKSQQFKKHPAMTDDQRKILDLISQETIDWEENEMLAFDTPDGFRGLPVSKKNSIRVAKISLTSLAILIPVVIFFNFFYPDNS
eukprot:gene2424-2994_t